MKYADDMSIPVRICVVALIVRENHYVCVCVSINQVLRSPKIIYSVVDVHSGMTIDLVLDEDQFIELC